jgi:hypothetical protein
MPRRAWLVPSLAAALVGGVLLSGPVAHADPSSVQLVSHHPDGTPAEGHLRDITPDGRWVLGQGSFTGASSANDADVFLADGATDTATSVSADPDASPPGWADAIGTTADANTVVWDVDHGQTAREVYVTDRAAGTTRHALTLPADAYANRWTSRDAKVLFFMQHRDGDDRIPWDYSTADLATGEVRRVDARPDGTAVGVSDAAMAPDGSAVVFLTADPELWPGLQPWEVGLVRRDLRTGALERLTVQRTGAAILGVSVDAGTVVLAGYDGVHAWSDGSARRVDLDEHGTALQQVSDVRVSDDGRYVAFLGGPSGDAFTAYRRDVPAGTTELVSVDPDGNVVTGIDRFDLSDDGSTVAFSETGRLVVRHVDAGTSVALCCPDGHDGFVSSVLLDGEGNHAAFETWTKQGDGYAVRVFRWDDPSAPLPAPVPVLSIADAAAGEGEDLVFQLTSDLPMPRDTTIRWEVGPTGDGRPAAAGDDLDGDAGSVELRAGEDHAEVRVPTIDDPDHEPDEVLAVHLEAPDPTFEYARQSAVGTILDDDPRPTASVAATHVAEDAGEPMTWTVSLDRTSFEPVTVRWRAFVDTSAPSDRRAGTGDFTPASGTATFAPGEVTQAVSAQVVDDALPERDEWFVIELFDAAGASLGQAKATGTINDDEVARIWSVPRSIGALLR